MLLLILTITELGVLTYENGLLASRLSVLYEAAWCIMVSEISRFSKCALCSGELDSLFLIRLPFLRSSPS